MKIKSISYIFIKREALIACELQEASCFDLLLLTGNTINSYFHRGMNNSLNRLFQLFLLFITPCGIINPTNI